MNWYLQVLKKYAEFSGRARRKEYWMFTLFNIIFLIIANILDNILGTAIEDMGYGLFYILYTLAILIPGLAVSVRRLHDVGKSGWMILISLIPIIGLIWLFVLLVTDSNPGENKYGANPKEAVKENSDPEKQVADILSKETGDPAFIHQHNWSIAISKNDNKTALNELNKALDIVPHDPHYLTLRAMTYYKLNKFADANTDLKNALKRNPSQKEAIDFLAAMKRDAMACCNRARKLDRKQTILELNKAVELDPDNPELFYFRGVTLSLLGQFKPAINDIEQTLKLDPQYPDAQKALQALKNLAKKGSG
jgi:uncharacterized membrane protein YhaH (DUF805 family)/Flp pilus assembly protein TadD